MSVHKKAIGGMFWQLLNFSSVAIIQIGYLMLMARMLPKEAHGHFAILNVFVSVFSIFSQVGVSSALIQKKEISDSDVSFAFYATLGLSLIIFGAVSLLSPLLAEFYNHDVSAIQIIVISSTVVFSSLTLVPMALLQRSFKYKRVFTVNMLALMLGYALTGIITATIIPNVWAMIWVTVIYSFVLMLSAFGANPIKLTPLSYNKDEADILKYGFNLSLIRLLSYFPSQIDKLILGKFVPASFLGIWTRGQFISLIPGKYFGGLFDGVLFSYFSKLQHDKALLQRIYLRILSLLTILLTVISVFCVTYAREVVLIFLGRNWEQAEQIVVILSLAIPLSIMARTTDIIARSSATLKPSRNMKIVYLALVVASALIGGYFKDMTILSVTQLAAIGIYVVLMLRIAALILNLRSIEVFKEVLWALPVSVVALLVSLGINTYIKAYWTRTLLTSGISLLLTLLVLGGVVYLYPGILGRANCQYLRKIADLLPQSKLARPVKLLLIRWLS